VGRLAPKVGVGAKNGMWSLNPILFHISSDPFHTCAPG
jgi:hypothetical protein